MSSPFDLSNGLITVEALGQLEDKISQNKSLKWLALKKKKGHQFCILNLGSTYNLLHGFVLDHIASWICLIP